MKFHPNGARLLVKMDKEADVPSKTKGGILLPETARKVFLPKTVTGVILEVGNGKWNDKAKKRIPLDEKLKPGVRVMTDRYWGDIIQLDGSEHRVLGEHQVLGIVEDWDGYQVSGFGHMPGQKR